VAAVYAYRVLAKRLRRPSEITLRNLANLTVKSDKSPVFDGFSRELALETSDYVVRKFGAG
jgi:hypothetical protein